MLAAFWEHSWCPILHSLIVRLVPVGPGSTNTYLHQLRVQAEIYTPVVVAYVASKAISAIRFRVRVYLILTGGTLARISCPTMIGCLMNPSMRTLGGKVACGRWGRSIGRYQLAGGAYGRRRWCTCVLYGFLTGRRGYRSAAAALHWGR